MKKLLKVVCVCMVLALLVWCGTVIADREILSNDIIRLHVVANSDSPEDQALKLQVKDAIVSELQGIMDKLPTAEDAKAYLLDRLEDIQVIVDYVLENAGSTQKATIGLTREAFDTRHYDTFSLPAGIYDSLRITLGEGEGRNWWCVVFPTLCAPATTEAFEVSAVGSGFDDSLAGALAGEQPYQVRFFLLDCLGKLQNFFFQK